MSLEDLLLRDELKRESPTPGETQRLLEVIERRLQDAGREVNHPETRLEQAYHAIHGCALAALRARGLRPTDRPGHHIVTVESLIYTLRISPERVDYFQTLRDLRNKALYTGAMYVTVGESEEAIEEATKLHQELKTLLGRL